MPETNQIVINTGPILALIAATENLSVLNLLYKKVYVTYEVAEEILKGGISNFGVKEYKQATFLDIQTKHLNISPILTNSLDIGEASVIQFALDNKIQTVCIDESSGRRIAKLYNLSLTGSIGILIKAKNNGYINSMRDAINKMKSKGVYLSDTVVEFALKKTKEI